MAVSSRWLTGALPAVVLCLSPAPAGAQEADRSQPLSPERLDRMVPKHPDYLGALAPENLRKPRPAPPFDLTGTWFVDLAEGFNKFLFGPPYPEFFEGGREALREAPLHAARNETYRDSIGQCFPPGMPMIMTRVWPHAFIQLPTAIFMISGFNNSVRTIFLDGREFSDPDLVVPGYNGESIGRWDGDTLVVESTGFKVRQWLSFRGTPVSPNGKVLQRIRKVHEDRWFLEIITTIDDPAYYTRPWSFARTYSWRPDFALLAEYNCEEQNGDKNNTNSTAGFVAEPED